MDANYRLVAPPPTRGTAIGGCPRNASYDMLGEQLNYFILVKHGYATNNLAYCTNQQPPQRNDEVPGPVWVGSKWLLAFPRVPVTPGTPLIQTIFWLCCSLNHRKRARCRFLKSIALFLSSYLFLVCLLILLLLMSDNVILTLDPSFPVQRALEM